MPERPRISGLVVNFRGGRYIDLLLRSLEVTLVDVRPTELRVIDNYHLGYRAETRALRAVRLLKHYLRLAAAGGREAQEYEFHNNTSLNVKRTRSGVAPVFWSTRLGIRGKAVSLSHSAGLNEGYRSIGEDKTHIMVLDQDVAFLRRGWLDDMMSVFEDREVVLAGAFRDDVIYPRPFLRPYLLIFQQGFFRQFGDVFRPTEAGDTCSRLTYLCEDHGKKYHLFQNSLNDPWVRETYSGAGYGDVAVDSTGRVFVAHKGHGASVDGTEWLTNMQRCLELLVSCSTTQQIIPSVPRCEND